MNKNNIAVVVGGTGSIGAALANELKQQGFSQVVTLGRSSQPMLELTNEASIEQAAIFIKSLGKPICLLFDATGILHDEQNNQMPEKTYKQINLSFLKKNFEINTFGPALIIKHFFPLLDCEEQAVFASLSAKVGSIADNKYGGWYSYRASKAALNQLIKTASIELSMKNKKAICVSMHPGTVTSKLSKPFQKEGLTIQSPKESAKNMIQILVNLKSQDTGSFFNWDGKKIPW
jgi:NAD(P)-dependent dehydrogenase (short-subunit alcohol dehydrogenase family)